jgi:hypothetical protein
VIVVASRDGERRSHWAREIAGDGRRVVRCATQDCPLLRGERCGTLARASAAIYDEENLPPELFLALVRARARPVVLFARDAMSDGQHHARFTRVLHGSEAKGAPHP